MGRPCSSAGGGEGSSWLLRSARARGAEGVGTMVFRQQAGHARFQDFPARRTTSTSSKLTASWPSAAWRRWRQGSSGTPSASNSSSSTPRGSEAAVPGGSPSWRTLQSSPASRSARTAEAVASSCCTETPSASASFSRACGRGIRRPRSYKLQVAGSMPALRASSTWVLPPRRAAMDWPRSATLNLFGKNLFLSGGTSCTGSWKPRRCS